jgi:hypothetical protein
VLKLAHVIEIFFVIAVLLLLLASTLLIANTIRLSIFSRRREIGDEARRCDELVRARPVHARRTVGGIAGALGAMILLMSAKRSRCVAASQRPAQGR